MGKRTRRRNRSAQPGAGTSALPDRQSLRDAVARRIVGQALDLAVHQSVWRTPCSPSTRASTSRASWPLRSSGRLPRGARDVARAALELEPASLPALTLAG